MEEAWIEPAQLAQLAPQVVSGAQSFVNVLQARGVELIRISAPSCPALDLDTWRNRHQRHQQDSSLTAHGFDDFLAALEDPRNMLRAVAIHGDHTNYVLLLTPSISQVVASLAIDRPDWYEDLQTP